MFWCETPRPKARKQSFSKRHSLLTAKILSQYPGYEVLPVADGNVIVRRPGQADVPVDINAIAQFCRRGTRDCDYATDQMLLELAPPRK